MGTTLTIEAMLNGPCSEVEDGMLNNYMNQLNAVPRLGSIGVAAGEECAHRSEVFRQH